jgi:hypothetical protein
MAALLDYEDKYPSIRFDRWQGVLQMALHHEGGEFIVTEPALRTWAGPSAMSVRTLRTRLSS